MGMDRRVSALEEYLTRRVEERLEQELEGMLTRLEESLPRQEYIRVLEVVSQEERHGD